MLNKLAAVCLVVFMLLMNGCEASFNVTTASLSEPVLALKVDEKTQAPLEKADNITPDTQTIFATIKVSTAPSETKVKAVFFYVEGSAERQIAEDTVLAAGTQYVSFSLSPPDNGWPVGEYRVQFYMNDKEKDQIRFSVRQAKAEVIGQQAPPAREKNYASQPSGNGGGYLRLNESRFGFSFEVPASWSWKLIPGTTDYLISGPAGTETSEISVIVQVIDTRLDGSSPLRDQMVSLVDQFSQIAGSEIVKKDVIVTAGQEAPFFIVTYMAQDSRGQQVDFGHTQMGIDHAPYVLLVSYSAPRDIYQNNLGIFQHIVDSMVLSAPQG